MKLNFIAIKIIILISSAYFPVSSEKQEITMVNIKLSSDKKILNITEENFNNFILGNKLASALIFYKSEIYNSEISKILLEVVDDQKILDQSKNSLFIVDCSKFSKICKKEMIDEFPIIRIYQNGKHYKNLESDFNITKILENVDNLRRTKVLDIEKLIGQGLDNFKRKKDWSLLLYRRNCEMKDNISKIFYELSKFFLIPIKFYEARNIESIQKLEINLNNEEILNQKEQENLIYLIRNNGELALYDKKPDLKELENWVSIEAFLPIMEIDSKSIIKFLSSPFPLAFGFYRGNDKELMKRFLEDLSEKFRGFFTFGISEMENHKSYLKIMRVPENKKPILMINDIESNLRYIKLMSSYDIKEGQKYLKSFIEGKLKPWKLSEPIKEEKEDGILKLVYDNFEKVTTEKEILVIFHSPMCLSCQKILKNLKILAIVYKASEKLFSIGKYNLAENDNPTFVNLDLTHIPSIYLFYKNQKKAPIKYVGNFSAMDLITFVKERTKYDYDLSLLNNYQFNLKDFNNENNSNLETDGISFMDILHLEL